SSYLNAYKGITAAGGGVQRTFDTQDTPLQDGLRIVYKTAPVPAHPIAVHPRVSLEIVAALYDRIIDIGQNRPDMLRNVPLLDPIATDITDYASLRDLDLEDFIE
ncbi:MAG: PhnD/SsuA/transferrin family substrate-binding protein, partial [Pseudomonadota bacterium]